MKKYFIIISVFISTVIFAQEKYMIYFSDKGEYEGKLLKNDEILKINNLLTSDALYRREKAGAEIFTYVDIPVSEKYIERLRSAGVKIHHKLNWFNAVSAHLTTEQIKQLNNLEFVKEIKKVGVFKAKLPSVEKKENNSIGKTENLDYGFSLTQNLLSDIPVVHEKGFSGESIKIGLLDTGFDWKNNTSLKDRIILDEWDFVNNDPVTANQDNDTYSQDSHGTAVFSIIGGFHPGEIIGPAYNASYLLAKTEDVRSETNVEEDNFAAALEWMEAKGVDIVSSSLGYSEFDDGSRSYTYEEMDGKTTIVVKAAEIAFSKGVLVITSAGNEGNKPWKYITSPADGEHVIAVGAVNSFNEKASFSSWGPTPDGRIKPDLSAMGVSVYHASRGSYGFGNGTSYSAPIVAGIAGQLLSAHPYLNNIQLRSILLESCDKAYEPDNGVGHGLLSAEKALNFPNINSVNGIEINKYFISKNDSAVSAKIFIKNGNGFTAHEMNLDGNYRFKYFYGSANDSLIFYFQYKTDSGKELVEPANKYYVYNPTLKTVEYAIKNNTGNDRELRFELKQNYPNPFSTKTTLEYTLPEEGNIAIEIYNILGQRVEVLKDRLATKGNYIEEFDLTGLASGVYFIRFEFNGKESIKKAVKLN